MINHKLIAKLVYNIGYYSYLHQLSLRTGASCRLVAGSDQPVLQDWRRKIGVISPYAEQVRNLLHPKSGFQLGFVSQGWVKVYNLVYFFVHIYNIIYIYQADEY